MLHFVFESNIGGWFLGFGLPQGPEWIILLVLGLLIFGRRLPEVGRSLGRGIVEFKKGIKGVEDEIEEESSSNAASKRLSDAPPRHEFPRQSQGEEANPYATVEKERRDA